MSASKGCGQFGGGTSAWTKKLKDYYGDMIRINIVRDQKLLESSASRILK